MKLYNRDCKRLELKNKEVKFLNNGECAKVFRIADTILKLYYLKLEKIYKISPDVFDVLKDINDEHFMQLYDLYSEMDIFELISYRLLQTSFSINGYTAKYYPASEIDVLSQTKDYLLDNLHEIEKIFTILTDNSIATNDVKRENVVLTNNSIVIIDPDQFRISNESPSDIAIINKKKVLNLFRSLSLADAISYPKYGSIVRTIDADFSNIPITENTDVTYEISKKLTHVNRPIDYFYNR